LDETQPREAAKEALIEIAKGNLGNLQLRSKGNLTVAMALIKAIGNPKVNKTPIFGVLEHLEVRDEKLFNGLLNFINKPGWAH